MSMLSEFDIDGVVDSYDKLEEMDEMDEIIFITKDERKFLDYIDVKLNQRMDNGKLRNGLGCDIILRSLDDRPNVREFKEVKSKQEIIDIIIDSGFFDFPEDRIEKFVDYFWYFLSDEANKCF